MRNARFTLSRLISPTTYADEPHHKIKSYHVRQQEMQHTEQTQQRTLESGRGVGINLEAFLCYNVATLLLMHVKSTSTWEEQTRGSFSGAADRAKASDVG